MGRKKTIRIVLLLLVCFLSGRVLREVKNELEQRKAAKELQNGQDAQNDRQKKEAHDMSGDVNDSGDEEEKQQPGKGKCIVIDAGHGGYDPGKVSKDGGKEKDVNLAIALRLQENLNEYGFEVVMTRTEDEGLYSEYARNKKAEDMRARIKKIEESAPVLAVSIHQNSFSDIRSFGAQVFYYKGSAEGKSLAETLQKTLISELADGNYRKAKANDTYYLLKKSNCPMVIVECGFMSNPMEAELLFQEEYQKKIAKAICLGIIEYCKAQK